MSFSVIRQIHTISKMYHYQNSLLKKNPLTFSKSDKSIISGICFSSIFSSYFFHLYFTRVGSATLSISLSLKRHLSKLVNRWLRNNFVKSLNCFLLLFMIAKKSLHKSLVLLKSWHEQLQSVSLSPKDTLYINFVSIIPGSPEQTSKDPSVCSLAESVIRVDTLWERNVTNDHGLFCKYEGIFSACFVSRWKCNVKWHIFSVEFWEKSKNFDFKKLT